MFATRRQVSELNRELQQMRLIVTRLRRDLNLAQRQLSKLEGWGDDFIKTHQISDTDTRFFERHALPHEPDLQEDEAGCASARRICNQDPAPASESSAAEGPADSGV